ncbi:MAG: hypothetical protein J6B80_02290 [Clostridia bacterium]|nr:hypothetical protein [Clostridia bacterium]
MSQTPFEHKKLNPTIFKNSPKFDVNEMYSLVVNELGLQQSKRDQLITIYLAAFAFIIPTLLSSDITNWILNGCIFIGLGVIGILFAFIIIRYRKYKEIYWLCCRTLNVMMDVDENQWSKENIQGIFYNCMLKKIGKAIENGKFKIVFFVTHNLFSSETLYLMVHTIITASVTGFGVGILVPLSMPFKITIGVITGIIIFLLCLFAYFYTLIKLYWVCIDGSDASFNAAFKEAWFLHFFVSRKEQ